MKKLALVLVASAFIADAAVANIGTGFYAGAHLGYGSATAKVTSTGGGGVNPIVATTGSYDVGGNGANLGIMGGYGIVQSCMYWGGELAYTYENMRSNDTLETGFTGGYLRFKRDGYFEAALRGGYVFTSNTMFYLRLGIRWAKWSLHDSLNSGFNTTFVGKGSKSTISFAPGFGMETAIHRQVYLRVEYLYEFAPSVRASNSSNTAPFTNFATVRAQSGKVGLAYKF